MKEKKVGEVFEHNGISLKCIEVGWAFCDNCFFKQPAGDLWINDCLKKHKCSIDNRGDGKMVIFIKQ
jgi:hypothetical protein